MLRTGQTTSTGKPPQGRVLSGNAFREQCCLGLLESSAFGYNPQARDPVWRGVREASLRQLDLVLRTASWSFLRDPSPALLVVMCWQWDWRDEQMLLLC